MRKRMLSLFLAIVMAMTLLPGTAWAAGQTASGKCGSSATWSFDASSGTLTINGTGAMEDYNFDWDTKLTPWAEYNEKITSIVVSQGITHIGNEAFGSEWANGAMENLKTVSLPASLESIGNSAFACSNLTSVTLPKSLKTIGAGAFASTRLSSIHIPASVTSIGYNYEWDMQDSAFGDTPLKEITVDAGNNKYCAVDGVLYTKNMTTLVYYPKGKTDANYSIPSSVTGTLYIDEFWDIPFLRSITVPKGVTLADQGMSVPDGFDFDDSWKFVIYFNGSIPQDIGDWIYYADGCVVGIEARKQEDDGPAKIVGLVPANGTKGVVYDGTGGADPLAFYIKFDKPIASNDGQPYQAKVNLSAPGAFAIYRAWDNQLVYKPGQYSSFDFTLSADKTQLGIRPLNIRTILKPGTEYYITMGADFVNFENGMSGPAIKKEDWKFTTAGKTPEALAVTLTRSSIDLTMQKKATLTVSANQSEAIITWKSSNSSIASVTATGNTATVTGISTGTTTITATATWKGQKISAKCRVSVYPDLKVSFMEKTIYLEEGQSANLVYNCAPSGGKASFLSDNSNVVSVSSGGKIAGLKEGTTTVSVTYTVGTKAVTDKCTVTVKANASQKIQDFLTIALQQAGKTAPQLGLNGYWCDKYVGWCAQQAGLSSIMSPSGVNGVTRYQDIIKKGGNGVRFYNNREDMQDGTYLKNREDYMPAPGDIVIFTWDSNQYINHVGIVYKVENGRIYVVHGNYHGIVCGPNCSVCGGSSWPITSTQIYAYARPNWSAATGVKSGSSKVNIHCPVEVQVSYDHESLDSATGQLSTSYGSMILGSNESVSYTIDNYYDTHVAINGTGTGTMDADFSYNDDNGVVAIRSFRGVPISENTMIDVVESHDTTGSVTLIVYEGGNFQEAWYASSSKEVIAPDDNLTEWFKQNSSPQMSFTDVPADAYFANAVAWAVEHGITQGTSSTTFSPNTNCTRSQIVAFLWRANGEPEPTTKKNPFTDVKATDFYYKAVLWAVEEGITQGTSATTFSPNEPCTRSQAVTFLWRSEDQPIVSGTTKFTDVPAGEWYSDAVSWAVAKDVTQGTSATTFEPNAICSRAQIVTFLYRDMVG